MDHEDLDTIERELDEAEATLDRLDETRPPIDPTDELDVSAPTAFDPDHDAGSGDDG